MTVQKFRWSKVYESSEEELISFLKARAISATRIADEAFSELDLKTDDAQQTIYCAEGSFSLLVNGSSYSLQPGDGLNIGASTDYQIIGGISGFVYYSA